MKTGLNLEYRDSSPTRNSRHLVSRPGRGILSERDAVHRIELLLDVVLDDVPAAKLKRK